FCSWVNFGLRFLGAGGRVAVPARGENRARPPASTAKTNNVCQIKFELLQIIRCWFPKRSRGQGAVLTLSWDRARPSAGRRKACKRRGDSGDSFYRFRELYEKGGELALREISRRKPVLKNRTAPQIEQAVVDLAIEQPAWGQVRVSEMLKRQGLSISPAGVRCVWQRHDLTSIKHRLKAPEATGAQDGLLF